MMNWGISLGRVGLKANLRHRDYANRGIVSGVASIAFNVYRPAYNNNHRRGCSISWLWLIADLHFYLASPL
jgi:hypothetical protein